MAQKISRLLVSSSDLVVKSKADNQKLLSGLRPGRIITARVVGDSGPREAVLLIQGQRVAVKTHTPLKIDESITVKVQSTGRETVLKIMAEGANPPVVPLKTIPIPFRQEAYHLVFDLLNSLESSGTKAKPSGIHGPVLKKLLSTLALKSATPDREILGRIIRDGGLSWEHKLRRQMLADTPADKSRVKEMIADDLKALILEGLQHEPAEKSDAGGSMRVFVDQLEDLQLFNKQALEETGKFFFPFPISLEGEWRLGQLLIQLADRDEGAKARGAGVVRVALLLELSNLGELAADFSIFQKTVNGFFETADASVRDLIAAGIPELKSNLAAHGFKAEHVDCRLAVSSASTGLTLLERINTGNGLLNIVV